MARRRSYRNETRLVQQLLRTRAGRWLLLIVLLLVLGLWAGQWIHQHWRHAAPSPPVDPSAAPLRIATWNIREFSRRSEIDLRTIARIIDESRFDLVAIQEVQGAGEAVDALLNVLGPPWRGAAVSPPAGNGERFAYIYRGNRVRELPGFALIQSGENETFARVPYQGAFKAGNFDFILISCHLSYGDRPRRRREAGALARYVVNLANAPEHDILVVGDFNEQRPGNLQFFFQRGWQTLITEPTNLNSREIYDHILIDGRHTAEWTGQAGVVRFDETIFQNNDNEARRTVSDHRPAWAEFSITLPDDD